MWRIAIVDDDILQAQALEAMLMGHPRSSEFDVSVYATASELEERLELAASSANDQVDILFLDIVLGEGDPDGVSLVERNASLLRGTQVVYVTGYVGCHSSAYRTDHAYFLTKPVALKDLYDAVDRAIDRYGEDMNRPIHIHLRGVNVDRVVSPRQIEYAESAKRIVRIHSAGQVFETYAKLGDLQSLLPKSFIRCHKSFLINLAYVDEMTPEGVRMASGDAIPVSRDRRTMTRNACFSYARSIRGE